MLIKPDQPLDVRSGTWGAWEIVARCSTVNLNPLFGQPGVPGPKRRLLLADLELNWHWNAKAVSINANVACVLRNVRQ